MNKHFTRLLLFLTFISCAVLGARLMDIDQIRSSDRLKLWDMPISSGTLNTLTSVGTFTNKVISGSSNTLSNIPYTSLSSMSSANLATVVSDETGSGFLVFGTSPTLTGATLTNAILNSPATTGGTITSGNFVNPTISGASISGSSITTSTLTAPTVSSGTFTSPILVTPTLGAAQASSLVLNPSGGGLSSGAILELLSTSLTFVEPAMTTTQRDNISNKPNGSQIYNTTTSKLNYWNGGSWLQVASETSPTITGGSITSATFTSPVLTDSITTTQIATPSSPAASKNKIYTKSDDKLYVLTSGGVEKSTGGLSAWATTTPYAIGDVISYNGNTYIAISAFTSGASFEADILAAGKWKLVNTPQVNENLALVGNTFEDNDVGGWSAISLSSGTLGLPVTVGTGGLALSATNGGTAKHANLTAAAVTSSGPINGVYSLNFATTGTISAYSGYVSQAYAIPIKAQSKVMAASVSFKVVSGTFVMGGTSADSMAIAIYDPLNNAWIPNNGAFAFNQSSGVGIATTTFQTNSTTTSLQVYIYSPNSPTGNASFLVDDVNLQIQNVAYGSPVTDWQSYTPTGSWSSNTTYTGKWRRVGNNAQFQIKLALGGAPTAANLTVNLPSSLVIDVNNMSGVGSQLALPSASGTTYSGGAYYSVMPTYNNTTSVNVLVFQGASSVNALNFVSNLIPGTYANNDFVSINFEVPIVGWSSSVIMSTDAATNVVSARVYKAADQTGINTNGSAVKINFDTPSFDTNGGWASNKYTVNVAGKYKVSTVLNIKATNVLNSSYSAVIYKNGAGVSYNFMPAPTAGVTTSVNVADEFDCVSGDYFEIYLFGVGNNSSSTISLQGASAYSWVNITRNAGPAQIAASEFFAPTIQTFTSGTAQTYTLPSTPRRPKYIKVKMVGAGGGGGGGGYGSPGAGTAGTASTWAGSSTSSAGGGAAGAQGTGVGGTSSLGAGHIGTALTGGSGGEGGTYSQAATVGIMTGGNGGNSAFGGGGGGTGYTTGGNGATNTGGGGAGGPSDNNGVSNSSSGGGGGAGGFVEIIVSNLSNTYTYSVGVGGSAGAAGTHGQQGGAGAAGYIEVTEFYN